MENLSSVATSSLAGAVIPGIDDQADNIRYFQAMLEARKVVFFGAAGAAECFSLAARIQPRLILLDIQMPNMDGFETCRRPRAMRETQETPIAFLTARKSVEDVKIGLAAGGDDFIGKPFDPAKLFSRIEYWLARPNTSLQ